MVLTNWVCFAPPASACRGNGKRAEELVSDHLMRTLATINIWQ